MSSNDSGLLIPRFVSHRREPWVFSTTETNYDCEQRAYWSLHMGLGLERPKPSVNLSLGSLVHYTFADWGALYERWRRLQTTTVPPYTLPKYSEAIDWLPLESEPDPCAIFERHFAAFKADTYARYETFYGSEMDDSEWDDYEENVGEMGRALVANYVRRYGTPYPDGCTLLAPEQTIVLPVPKLRPRQRQLYIEGTLDQLLLDDNGMLLINDFKTFNSKPTDYELEGNDQFMTYHWLVQEEWGDRYQVAGVVYDGLWKRLGITNRMKSKEESDLQYRYYALYSQEKIANHAARLPYRLDRLAELLRRRVRSGPAALFARRGWATCPGCQFNEACEHLLEGDYGDWDDEAEAQALDGYLARRKGAAWRVPLIDLAKPVELAATR